MYVIGFNVPTIIRLLKPGEMRPARARRRRRKSCRRTLSVTEGFGLYPTIVNPPYTTLTAYDLNTGTIKWQIGLGDDLRLAGQGIKGTGTAATVKGGLIVTGDRAGVRHRGRPQGPRLRQRDRQADLRAAARRPRRAGAPSMYEHDGRQYLLVTASGPAGGPPSAAPTGIIAYALPRN